jgi:hypothetical protein
MKPLTKEEERKMKLYLGISQNNSHLYLAAIDNQGVAVFKTRFPSACPPEALTNSLKSLQQAFSASLRISTCLEETNQQHLLEAIQKEFYGVKTFRPSVFYSTDILPEEPFASPDPYRYPLLLAILDSLSD